MDLYFTIFLQEIQGNFPHDKVHIYMESNYQFIKF